MEFNRINIENKNPKFNKTFHFKTQNTNNSANLNFELENENRESNTNLKKTKQFVWISKRDKIIKKDKLKTYHSFEKLNINNYFYILIISSSLIEMILYQFDLLFEEIK